MQQVKQEQEAGAGSRSHLRVRAAWQQEAISAPSSGIPPVWGPGLDRPQQPAGAGVGAGEGVGVGAGEGVGAAEGVRVGTEVRSSSSSRRSTMNSRSTCPYISSMSLEEA